MPTPAAAAITTDGFTQPAWACADFAPADEGGVRAVWTPGDRHAGYDDRVHGGVLATLLDSAMVAALGLRGITALTADLRVRYRHAVPIGEPVTIEAVVTDTAGPGYRVSAAMCGAAGALVTAEGRFLRHDFRTGC